MVRQTAAVAILCAALAASLLTGRLSAQTEWPALDAPSTITPFRAGVAVSDQWLVQPLEILPGDQLPNRTFARTRRDFVVCRGTKFQPFDSGTALDETARRNNTAVASLYKAGRDQRPLLEAAMAEFEAGLQSDPQFFAFVYNAGRVALILEDRARAIAYFERARRLLPEFAGVHINLGRAYALGPPGVRQEQAALTALRAGARSNPLDRGATLALAAVYLDWNYTARAKELYGNVLRELPNSIAARLGLARVAVRASDWNTARRLLEAARLRQSPAGSGAVGEIGGADGISRREISRAVDYELALVYEELGAYDRAARRLERALEVSGDPIFFKISHAKAGERLERLRRRISQPGG